MEPDIRDTFLQKWQAHVPGADLPIACYYTDDAGATPVAPEADGWRCVIADLGRVRHGTPLAFAAGTIGCNGGQRYFGYSRELRPKFEYFLSCGIPGEMDGERYKKTPELVAELMKHQTPFDAPGKYIVFKRWDQLEETDQPAVVIFFAPPDVLAALFTLAGFDSADPQSVVAPFASGCSSIVCHPLRELQGDNPRAVLGMFDISARPYVPAGVLTLALPWPLFVRMVDNMDESFLITDAWAAVKKRVVRNAGSKG